MCNGRVLPATRRQLHFERWVSASVAVSRARVVQTVQSIVAVAIAVVVVVAVAVAVAVGVAVAVAVGVVDSLSDLFFAIEKELFKTLQNGEQNAQNVLTEKATTTTSTSTTTTIKYWERVQRRFMFFACIFFAESAAEWVQFQLSASWDSWNYVCECARVCVRVWVHLYQCSRSTIKNAPTLAFPASNSSNSSATHSVSVCDSDSERGVPVESQLGRHIFRSEFVLATIFFFSSLFFGLLLLLLLCVFLPNQFRF